jgi:hypothetical protein
MSAWAQIRPAGYAATEADAVRQALADVATWRSMRAGGFPAGCEDRAAADPDWCPDHARDEVIAAECATLRARLGGARS